jgi:hypothetical protein
MRIDGRKDLLSEPELHRVNRYTVATQAIDPVGKAAVWDRQRDLGAEAVSFAGRGQMRPWKERQIRARTPFCVGIEEVIGAGIVLVDAFLDQPHPENASVEIEVLLRRPGDRGDVVETCG